MTNNKDKARSLILAALMVFSVFAGTVAFTGGAAASASTWTTVSSDDVVTEESAYSQDLVVDVGLPAGESENVTLDLSGFQSSIDVDAASASSDNGNITVSAQDLNTSNEEFTFDLTNTNTGGSESANVTVTLTLNTTGASPNQGTSLTISAEDAGSDAQFSFDVIDGNTASGDNTIQNGSIVYQGQSVVTQTGAFTSGEDVVLRSGSPGDSTFENSFTANNDGAVSFGTDDFDAGQDYFLEGESSGNIVTFEVVKQSLTAKVDSKDVGNKGADALTHVDFTSNRQSFDLYVSADDLSASEVKMIVDDDLSTTMVDTNADGKNDAVQISVDRNTEYALNATGIDAGDYTLTFDVVDTTTSASSDFNVSDVGSGEASFEDPNVEVAQGDIAMFNISLDGAATGGSGTLVVGDADTDGYQANVSFTDTDGDGQVVVMFNTYAAGDDSNGTVAWAKGDDDVTFDNDTATGDQSDVTGLIAQGEYTVAVSTASDAEETKDSPQDLGTMFIGERSTDSMQLWTAPGAADLDADGEDGVTEDDIATLIDEGAVTQDNTIVKGDYLIHQVEATGLEGLLNAEGGLSAAINNGLQLSIEQTNPIQNQKAKKVNVQNSMGAMTLVEADGAYYIVVDTGSSSLDVERGGSDVSLESGDEFKATFTVADDRLLGSTDAEDHESVNASFEVEAADVEFDSTPVSVGAAAEQTISGTTNYAPGTELTIRVRSTGDTQPRFFNTKTVTVKADGTFSAAFDFSDNAEGDTFSVSVRKGGTEMASADGTIGAAPETETETTETETTETETTETETTETVTETDEPTTEETDEETASPEPEGTTETTTPGFGVAVALVALLAAALLAVRRD